jgi:hypothetical protein
VAAVIICSLLWAVTGVSVLAIALHEHHHHPAETHDHDDAFELVLHCHDGAASPHHDHELTAPLSASRTWWSGHLHSIVTQTGDLIDAEATTVRTSVGTSLESRDLGPPAFLLHCVLLT